MSLAMATGMSASSLASHPQLQHTARLVWQHVTLMWQAHRLHHHPALTPALPPITQHSPQPSLPSLSTHPCPPSHHSALTPALPPSHCSLQCLASTMTTFVPPRMQSLYRPSKRPSLSLTMSLTNKGLLNPAGENNCFLNSAVQVGSN